ncbi:alpha/beta hydrolase [Polycladomyces subterraneus]|uniref:Alpha/beta hydrolase-fold protein n=1 Tax=Polycladomyces subterraneus TaxID=1016997 RepID=A0ABT8IJP3_9BACL|nr:alpha/beta hydrolase-fold protein [Polycladomyces subterraneus]MDN4593015.1 alpha/beta hydrolase-fold protein [Polycladomyces subterraneus]
MLDEFSILITPFDTERTVRVYLPQSYHQIGKRFPVLYMHDGQNVFRDKDAIGGTSLGLEAYLDEIGFDLIVVGIDSNPSREGRVNEYCPWVNGEFSRKLIGDVSSLGGRGEPYVDFIVNELKPLIDNKYRTLPNKTYMAGVSLGGLISTFAACRYPEIFTKVAGISSAFYRNQEEIENLLRASDISAIELFYLDCGTEEAGEEHAISKEFVASNKAIYEILKSKVSNTKFQVVVGAEHNYKAFRKRVPKMFSFLFNRINNVFPLS